MGKNQGGHKNKPKGKAVSKKEKHDKKIAVKNGGKVLADKMAETFGVKVDELELTKAEPDEMDEGQDELEELGNNAEPIRKLNEDDSRCEDVPTVVPAPFDPIKLMESYIKKQTEK